MASVGLRRRDRVVLAARVDPEQREAIDDLARTNDRSLSAEVRRALAAYIDRERGGNGRSDR
jgi:predicted transcriptional regulator